MATALLIGPAAPAGASVKHLGAYPADAAFTYTKVTSSHLAGVPYSQGPAGHTLSIQLAAGVTVTATAQITGGFSLSAVVAGAQAQVSSALAIALSASVTYADAWTVPSGAHQGYLDAGAASDAMLWSHGQYNGACVWTVNGSGTLNSPYHLPAFWSWTT